MMYYTENQETEETGDINTIKDILPNIDDEYADILEIIGGTLMYAGLDDTEMIWAEQIGILANKVVITVDGVLAGVKDFANVTSTITIPSYVKSISNGAFFENEGIKKVDFSQNSYITEIPYNCFRDCINLNEIIFSDTITKIGEYAFYGTALTEMIFPQNISFVGSNAFSNCLSLTKVDYSQSKITVITSKCFQYCSNLIEVDFGEILIGIDGSAFNECGYFEEIIIPDSVEYISAGVFRACSIEYIKLPVNPNYTTMNQYTCKGTCKDLIIPEYVTTIGGQAINITDSVRTMIIPKNVESFSTAFAYSTYQPELEVVTDNPYFYSYDGVVYTKATADNGYVSEIYYIRDKKAGTLKIPAQVTKIDMSKVPSGITDIEIDSANSYFYVSNGITYSKATSDGESSISYIPSTYTGALEIPEGVTTLPSGVLVSGITSLSLPSTLTTIEEKIDDYKNIQSITISSSNKTLKVEDNSVYSNDGTIFYTTISRETLVLPSGVTTLDSDSLTITGLKTLNMSATNITELYEKDIASISTLTNLTLPNTLKTMNYYCIYNCDALETIIIPSGVETIEETAFYSLDALTTLELPTSLVSIGRIGQDTITSLTFTNGNMSNNNFEIEKITDSSANVGYMIIGNSGKDLIEYIGKSEVVEVPLGIESILVYSLTNIYVKEIELPNSIETIEDYAMQNCTSLEIANIPASVTNLGRYTFRGCTNLKDVSISNGVTSISSYCFFSCTSLQTIEIPSSVKTIGSYAFSDCISLTDIIMNVAEDTIYGAPWGATKGILVVKWE